MLYLVGIIRKPQENQIFSIVNGEVMNGYVYKEVKRVDYRIRNWRRFLHKNLENDDKSNFLKILDDHSKKVGQQKADYVKNKHKYIVIELTGIK